MRPLSDTDIVRVWERGCRATRMWRAKALIAAASENADDGAIASLTPGERDARLLSIRSTTFGRTLDCMTRCPSCGEQLEFVIEAAALLADPSYAADKNPATLTTGDYRVTVRPPTIGDVEALGQANGEPLFVRCVVHAERGGETIAPSDLPASIVAAIDDHLTSADPAAITELSMACPSCAHAWTQLFDIASYLWTEISARAERLLSEVHVLARAYGWSESAILALGAPKRARYLELVRG